MDDLKRKIRIWLIVFMTFLVLSGATAFVLEWETKVLNAWAQPDSFLAVLFPNLASWIIHIHEGVHVTYKHYPFMAYGTDWLAFAHIVIAIAFVGPLRDPIKNIWVIKFGMISCILVIPLALICGMIRGIPLFWRLIDCSFGVFGFIPLSISYRYIKQLEKIIGNRVSF